MNQFLAKHAGSVIGTLSGFDRLVFTGTLRHLAYPAGLKLWLWAASVLLKDFAAHAEAMTRRLKEASEALARRAGRPILYVRSATALKEAIAREDGIETGLICILTAPAFAGAGYRTVLVVPDPARPGRKAAVP